jgi:hypothetical protein
MHTKFWLEILKLGDIEDRVMDLIEKVREDVDWIHLAQDRG